MSTKNTSTLSALFAIPTPRTKLAQLEAADPQPDVEPQIRAASYTAITTRTPDPENPKARIVALRVDCPYCNNIHIHPGGTTTRPMRGTRPARCVGRSTLGQHYKLTGGEE